jgi:hypothetical protein
MRYFRELELDELSILDYLQQQQQLVGCAAGLDTYCQQLTWRRGNGGFQRQTPSIELVINTANNKAGQC